MTGPRSAQVATWAGGVFVWALGLALCQARQEKAPDVPKRLSIHNLKQIALALKYYTDAYARLPAAAALDPALSGPLGNPLLTAEELIKSQGKLKGKALPLVSWRVTLLPYLEEGELYKQYKMHEPWDSEHNKRLLARIPKVYQPVTGKKELSLGVAFRAATRSGNPFPCPGLPAGWSPAVGVPSSPTQAIVPRMITGSTPALTGVLQVR
jgi:hypothetical protein